MSATIHFCLKFIKFYFLFILSLQAVIVHLIHNPYIISLFFLFFSFFSRFFYLFITIIYNTKTVVFYFIVKFIELFILNLIYLFSVYALNMICILNNLFVDGGPEGGII